MKIILTPAEVQVLLQEKLSEKYDSVNSIEFQTEVTNFGTDSAFTFSHFKGVAFNCIGPKEVK